MAALLGTNTDQQRHVVGDLAVRFFSLSGANGDTFTYPGISHILQVVITPTTAIAVGATVAGNVVTFVSGGAWAAQVAIYSRVG